MAGIVVLTGGPGPQHDFDTASQTLAAILADDHHTTIVTDPDEAADRLRSDTAPQVFVVYAMRWQMLDDAFEPWRAEWVYHTPGSTRAAIDHFVRTGGGLIGLHSAPMCFDDWPQWADILGGRWIWGRSSNTTPQSTRLWITELDHPVVEGLGDGFEVVDQVFGDLELRDEALVLGWAKRSSDHEPEPMLWVNTHGRGRIVCDGFGHDAASLEVPAHRRLLVQSVEWVLGLR